MNEINGLVIDTPHIDNILSGKKVWEMRSSKTKQRGLVALIRKGSGTVVGIAEITDSLGPLKYEEMLCAQSKHLITPERLNDPRVAKWNHAWVLNNAIRFSKSIPYEHPNGAVIWVKLNATTSQKILDAIAAMDKSRVPVTESLSDRIEKFFCDNNGKTFEVTVKAVRVASVPPQAPRKPDPFGAFGEFSLLSPLQRRADEEP